MPRINQLADRESEICNRLQTFRKSTGLSRVAFAQKAGIDSSVIVRYEHGRVPLKYLHAWRLIRAFYINPEWLATGQGGRWTRAASVTPGPELLQSSEGALFSTVYDQVLSQPSAKSRTQKGAEQLGPSELRVRHEWGLQHWMRERLIELPDKLVPDFLGRLTKAGDAMLKEYPRDSSEAIKRRKADYQADLDTDVRLRLQGTI